MAPKSKIQTLTISIVNTAIGLDGVNIRNEEFVSNILTVDNINVGRSFFDGDNAIVQTTTFSFVDSVVENDLFNINGTFNNTHIFQIKQILQIDQSQQHQ